MLKARTLLFQRLSRLLLALIWLPSAGWADESAPNADSFAGLDFSGYIRGVAEFEEDEIAGEDLDAATYLSLNLKPAKGGPVSFHFYGRARADLDGESVTDEAWDRSDSRVFQAYLNLKEFPENLNLRMGRQWIHDIEGVYLDGLLLEYTIIKDLELALLGGRPVPVYTSADGESLFGVQLRFHPFQKTWVRVEGVRSDEGNPIVNDHLGFHVLQNIGAGARMTYDQKFLNNRDKDIRIGGSWFIENLGTELSGDYYERTSTTPVPDRDDTLARYFSDFYLLLEEVQELERFSFNTLKYIGEYVIVGAGLSKTNILEKENPFNRDTERYFVSIYFLDLILENLNLSLDANMVSSEFSSDSSTIFTDIDGSSEEVFTHLSQDDDSFFITGELEYELYDGMVVSAGSAYGDYDFERDQTTTQQFSDLVPPSLLFTTGSEGFITRTYFGELDWRMSKSWRTQLLVEYAHSKINSTLDAGDYIRSVASVTYRF